MDEIVMLFLSMLADTTVSAFSAASTDSDLLIILAIFMINNYRKRLENEEAESIWRQIQYNEWVEEVELSSRLYLHVLIEGNPSVRRWWSVPKSRNWWENIMLPERLDEFWLKNFRMTRSTFMDIAEQLHPFLVRKATNMRDPITVEHRLAITLYKLATNMEYRSVGNLFGVGRSTVCTIVHETCRAIEIHLMPKYIRFPQGQDLLDTVQRFRTKFGFPQVAGAIDGSHIPIKAPVESPEDYFNRKHFYSIVLQAVVDSDGKFINTNVGRPGSIHDARVFSLSSMSRKLHDGTLFNPNPTKLIEGQEIPLLILGDPAYPLLPNLMKGYTGHRRLTRDQRNFNYRLSSARFVVEHAFGRLKGRWRILNKQNDHCLEFNRSLVQACCTLHNICERNGDAFQQSLLTGVERHDMPHNHHHRPVPAASTVREALKEYLKVQ